MVPGGSNPPILGAVAPNFNKIGNMFLIKQNSYYFPLWRGFAAKPNRNFSTSVPSVPVLDFSDIIRRTATDFRSFDMGSTSVEDIVQEFHDAVSRYGVPSLDYLTLMPVYLSNYQPIQMRALGPQAPCRSRTPKEWLDHIKLRVEVIQERYHDETSPTDLVVFRYFLTPELRPKKRTARTITAKSTLRGLRSFA